MSKEWIKDRIAVLSESAEVLRDLAADYKRTDEDEAKHIAMATGCIDSEIADLENKLSNLAG